MKDPFMAHLGFAVLHLAPGEAVVAGEVGEAHLNLHGTAHGGFLYALADSAFALASNSRGPAVALSCRMDYFRPLVLVAQWSGPRKGIRSLIPNMPLDNMGLLL